MKTLVILVASATVFISCKKNPSAQAELSNKTPVAGELIQVKNLSVDGDASYIKMNGDGLFNGKLFVQKTFIATQKDFKFTYSTPGTYEVEVVTERSDFMSGTEKVSSKYTVTVLPVAEKQQ